MDLFSELIVGEKIEIEPMNKKNNDKSFIVSQLIDIKNNLLHITNPIKRGIPYPLLEGQQIKIIFYREEKGIFRFVAEIRYKVQSRIVIYAVEPISQPERIQRRYFFRLDIILNAFVGRLEEEAKCECIVKDLSGGGMKLVSKAEFKEGEILECHVNLKDGVRVTTVGEVIRSIKDPITNEYELGVRFKDISESVRNKIISFLFERQRLLRKKGLI
ncbi:hypothetical protein F8154_04925 [Alkaliphilus pronyensis]|uniref:Flagellar brake protein n=1 Tax=Alkaliphilus pronyensis TaxID=1482732 RepID=A0A6I0F3E4_9FIRM|nr:PilZ domain-containing protein [Alkaliphilus pronyensis]KAB3535862.1 hypothetical protein F8154_04925 [Alkaliphilus pronyensis]